MPGADHSIPSKPAGFTLVEILLVVALIGILLSLAAPSYRDFLQRTHRTEAIAQLLRVATCQERIRAATGTYDIAECLPRGGQHYLFTYTETPPPSGHYFRVAAQPLGDQSGDGCGRLLLDSLGARTSGGADPVRCWSGR